MLRFTTVGGLTTVDPLGDAPMSVIRLASFAHHFLCPRFCELEQLRERPAWTVEFLCVDAHLVQGLGHDSFVVRPVHGKGIAVSLPGALDGWGAGIR